MEDLLKVKADKKAEKERLLFIDEIVDSITEDFEKRRKERLNLERQWELNMNFLRGNQFIRISSRGSVIEEDKDFYWQNREVFNHIAPIMETRLAKLSRINPIIAVSPNSDDDNDIIKANTSEKLISEALKQAKMEKVSKEVTSWSETCGTGFYKVIWDNQGGNKLGSFDGKEVYEGEIKIIAVSPFEIFPDSIYRHDLNDCKSIIHAKAVGVKEIFARYGVSVAGEVADSISLTSESKNYLNDDNRSLSDSAIVIEKYELPSVEFPNGRLITIAGGKLLYYGELPYKNGKNGERGYPFVKQDSVVVSGRFFGMSIIERLIPVQRAYNAVKNRKHEFINRLTTGIMMVEDGSIDTDDLAEDGLSPGKVLVYRQGSKAPEIMAETSLPPDFNDEEDRLLNEFVIISGVSDVASSRENAKVTSGTALEILIEQDNERLTMNAELIRNCYLEISKQILKLYSQFITGVKALKFKDSADKTRIIYADGNSADSDDVYIANENELLSTPSQKKEIVFKLFESGLLGDEHGNIRNITKEKILSLLGYKDLDYTKGLSRLHEERAQAENQLLLKGEVCVLEIDEDEVHVEEHTRFILSEFNEVDEKVKSNFFNHIKQHKEKLNIKTEIINN